jgi:hypothetical protein
VTRCLLLHDAFASLECDLSRYHTSKERSTRIPARLLPAQQHLILYTMSDPLDTNRILDLLPTLLPRSTSSPLPHTTASLAALVHAIHTALSFRLVRPADQQGDQGEEDAPDSRHEHDFDDGASETTTAVDQDEAGGDDVEARLWNGWNHRAEDSYSFTYKHEQSSMTFRLRVGRMGGRVQIDGMAEVSLSHHVLTCGQD